MGLGTVLWHWLSSKFWFDWLCLFLIINPYFLCYYGYDSIGSIMDDTGKLLGNQIIVVIIIHLLIDDFKSPNFANRPFLFLEKLFRTDKSGIGLLYSSTLSCNLFM